MSVPPDVVSLVLSYSSTRLRRRGLATRGLAAPCVRRLAPPSERGALAPLPSPSLAGGSDNHNHVAGRDGCSGGEAEDDAAFGGGATSIVTVDEEAGSSALCGSISFAKRREAEAIRRGTSDARADKITGPRDRANVFPMFESDIVPSFTCTGIAGRYESRAVRV